MGNIMTTINPEINETVKQGYNNDRILFEKHMSNNGITTIIHYPIPIHKTSIFDTEDIVFSSLNTDKTCNRIVSIPIHPFLTDGEINHIINTINNY